MRSLSHWQHPATAETDQPARPNPRSRPEILLLTAQTLLLLAMTVTVVTKVWQDDVWFGWLLVGVTCVAWLPGSDAKA